MEAITDSKNSNGSEYEVTALNNYEKSIDKESETESESLASNETKKSRSRKHASKVLLSLNSI
jgi:hypothetical protein